MREGLLYLVFISTAIALIYGIIQFGHRLVAPAALPKAWHLEIEANGHDCAIFPSGEAKLALSQSGETISVTVHLPAEAELHGKLGRDGAFRLAGQVSRGRLSGCRRGSLVWEGTATPQEMAGIFTLSGADCNICPNPLRIQGSPER